MAKLAVICEGKTERKFCDELLVAHLAPRGIEVQAIEIGVDCLQPGGNVTFARVLHDLELLLPDYDYVTTLVDFFRLCDDWTGLNKISPGMSSSEQAEVVEQSALDDAKNSMPNVDVATRFIPNVLMHEFEGLLFTDPAAIVDITRAHSSLADLTNVAAAFPSPEDINTGRDTAPSKRLKKLGANYGKIAHGARIAAQIGVAAIRTACPHFDLWLSKLENLDEAIIR